MQQQSIDSKRDSNWHANCLIEGMTSERKSFLLGQLQAAIDEAVSDSGRVSAIVDEMKHSGYDLCLLLESTVTISPTEGYEPDAVPEPRLAWAPDAEPEYKRIEYKPEYKDDFELTDEDVNFLQEMNIAA
jgi:hypothetical protein